MDRNLVIKVKYGDTLRRFNAYVDINGSLNLDLNGLREKILDLFKFSPDADLTLTYIDEDFDVVTLVDDDDLHDAIRQFLRPLRINVLLNTNRGGRSDTISSTCSTPMRSSQTQTSSFSPINSNMAPEPVCDTLTKLSRGLTSKAPVSVSPIQAGSTSDGQTGASESLGEGREASKDSGPGPRPISQSNFTHVYPDAVNNLKNWDSKIVTEGMWTSVILPTPSVDLKLDSPADCGVSGSPSLDNTIRPILECTNTDRGKMIQKETDGHHTDRILTSNTWYPNSTVNHPIHPQLHPFPVRVPPFPSFFSPKQQASGIGNSSMSQVGFNSQNSFPIKGQSGAETSDGLQPDGLYQGYPFKRSYGLCDSRAIHKGVRCNGCGVYPITGPRFKSKLKKDYDLCRVCISEIGNDGDYARIDYPVPYLSPQLFKDIHEPRSRFRAPPLHVMQRSGMKSYRPKLDSYFIKDLSVMDGTIIAPTTTFTKIWRVYNNGTIVWPQGTQLVWIGGDKLTDRVSVELEIPKEGIYIDKVLDIGVTFTAPERPGRYISFWKMALPSGEQFGQRIWVLVEVQKDNNFPSLNLNLALESSLVNGQNPIDVNLDPFEGSHLGFDNYKMSTDLVKSMVEKHRCNDQELDFSVNDGLLSSNGVPYPTYPTSPMMPEPVSYPTVDFSAGPSEPFPAVGVPTFGNTFEQTLLKELDYMGFNQIDLNKEVLKKNEYNLEFSVDELCDFAKWDPILNELQEMGFCNREKNMALLIKHDGSIKRVVLDLIAGERVEL